MPTSKNPPSLDHVRMIEDLCTYIRANPDEVLSLEELGKQVCLSPAHLQRVFRSVTGVTPRQFVDACRVSRLKSRLKERQSVTAATLEAGFGSSSRVYERAGSHLGMTPAEYQRGGSTKTIRYTVVACPLGRLLLAGTTQGVCAVRLGDDDAALEEELRTEFSAAEIVKDDPGLHAWVTAVVDHLRGEVPHIRLPLDVRATAFQRRVWEALQQIPYGETRTYKEIATSLGDPGAARAVAGACAANPTAVVVPCHRAVRSDGDLAGYRWGIERKRKLLAAERTNSEAARG